MSGDFHHYVPQSVLRAFSKKVGKKYKILFISKLNNKGVICRNVRRVAGENGFHDFKGNSISLEKEYFNRIDSDSAGAIKRLLNINHIAELETHYREITARFMAAQICRVPAVLDQFNAIEQAVKKDVSAELSAFGNNVNDYFLKYIVKHTEAYTNLLMKKKVTLIKSSVDQYVIGDNPVIILDGRNVVLNADDVTCTIDAGVFMMPISPRDILVFFDGDDMDIVKNHASNNNDWQFINAAEYIFSYESKQLEDELAIYHQNCYKNLKSNQPGLIEKLAVNEGDPLSIGLPKYSFEGEAKQQVLELINKENGVQSYRQE